MAAVLSLLGEVERELRAQAPSTPDAAEDRSEALLEMCLSRLDDAALLLDRLHRVEEVVLRGWIEHRPNDVTALVQAMETHLSNPAAWGERGFDAANARIAWLRRVATLAVELACDGILEDAATSLLRCDAHWERFPQRHATREWLESLTGAAARTVARVISRERMALQWLLAEGWFPDAAAPPIRAACEAQASVSRG